MQVNVRGDSLKIVLSIKLKKNYVSIYKQILRVKKKKKNITKTFAEIGRTPLKINVEIKNFYIFSDFHRKNRFFLRRKSCFRRMGEIYENKIGAFQAK